MLIIIAKRLIAISSIIQGTNANDFNLNISQAEHESIKKCRPALLPHIGLMVKSLFNAPPTAHDATFEEVRKYVREMMCGQDMGGFLVIHEFMKQNVKTRAHINAIILKEAKAYREMYEKVESYCKDQNIPIEGYKLIDPKGSLIHTGLIRNIRFCAIYYKKKHTTSWAAFANIDNMPGVNSADLAMMCDATLKLAGSSVISSDDTEIAKYMSIPLNDKNEVVEEGGLTTFQMFNQFMAAAKN